MRACLIVATVTVLGCRDQARPVEDEEAIAPTPACALSLDAGEEPADAVAELATCLGYPADALRVTCAPPATRWLCWGDRASDRGPDAFVIGRDVATCEAFVEGQPETRSTVEVVVREHLIHQPFRGGSRNKPAVREGFCQRPIVVDDVDAAADALRAAYACGGTEPDELLLDCWGPAFCDAGGRVRMLGHDVVGYDAFLCQSLDLGHPVTIMNEFLIALVAPDGRRLPIEETGDRQIRVVEAE